MFRSRHILASRPRPTSFFRSSWAEIAAEVHDCLYPYLPQTNRRPSFAGPAFVLAARIPRPSHLLGQFCPNRQAEGSERLPGSLRLHAVVSQPFYVVSRVERFRHGKPSTCAGIGLTQSCCLIVLPHRVDGPEIPERTVRTLSEDRNRFQAKKRSTKSAGKGRVFHGMRSAAPNCGKAPVLDL
jgi:hypothetical protein